MSLNQGKEAHHCRHMVLLAIERSVTVHGITKKIFYRKNVYPS